jgi:starch synthase
VGTNVCGIPEMVAGGETGLLVEPGDVAALTEALRALAADPARARAMGRAGRERVAERFTWPAVTARMLAAIEPRLEARERDPVRRASPPRAPSPAP